MSLKIEDLPKDAKMDADEIKRMLKILYVTVQPVVTYVPEPCKPYRFRPVLYEPCGPYVPYFPRVGEPCKPYRFRGAPGEPCKPYGPFFPRVPEPCGSWIPGGPIVWYRRRY